MLAYLLVAVGGALGSLLRFWISGVVAESSGPTFPYGTLVVNVSGSFVIGLFAALADPQGRWLVSPSLRQFLMIGLCGGYTTFSSFSLQTLTLAQDGEWLRAFLNCVASLHFASRPSGLGNSALHCSIEPEIDYGNPREAVLLRIFIGESDRWKHQPLFEAIVMKARELLSRRIAFYHLASVAEQGFKRSTQATGAC